MANEKESPRELWCGLVLPNEIDADASPRHWRKMPLLQQ